MMQLWQAFLRRLGIHPTRSPIPVEEREPGLRFMRETQARIRREIEDRRRTQYLEDQEALWEQERDLRRWDAS
jgi:hypothetical protein